MNELEALQDGELRDEVGSLKFLPPPMKKSDTRDSISSVDSDVSLSFDRRASKTGGEETDADFSDSDSSDLEVTEHARVASVNRIAVRAKSRHKPINADPETVAINDDTSASAEPRIHDTTSRQDERATLVEGESTALTRDDNASNRKTTDDDDEDETPRCSDELAEKITAQVEFYLSDENIVKDAFLLKHVKRNKEGWVSLKLISSFKRVKHLSRDWRIVGTALRRKSTKLEVNEQATKLRRKNPLPPYDQTMPSRTVLATKLPLDKLSVESVAELFARCGDIVLIRVLRPGNPTPTEVRHAIEKRPELANGEECALIEFTDSAAARSAMRMPLGDARIYELQHSFGSEKKRKQAHQKQQAAQPLVAHASKSAHARENTCNSSSCASGGSDAEDPRVSKNAKYARPHPACHRVSFGPNPAAGAHYFRGPPPSTEAMLARRVSSCSVTGLDDNANGLIFRRLSSCSGSSSDTGVAYPARRFSCSSGMETGGCGLPPGIVYDHHVSHNGSQNPGQVYPSIGYCGQARRFSCCSASGTIPASPTTNGYGWNYEYANSNAFSGTNGGRRGSADCGPFLRRLSSCSRDSGFFDQANRRLSSCSSSSDSCSGQFRSRSNSGFLLMAHLPENVTRMPSGPDGTRGFGRLVTNLSNHHNDNTRCSLSALSTSR